MKITIKELDTVVSFSLVPESQDDVVLLTRLALNKKQEPVNFNFFLNKNLPYAYMSVPTLKDTNKIVTLNHRLRCKKK